jgi:N-acetyl-S-(2-succino)cysteine monooxygenase
MLDPIVGMAQINNFLGVDLSGHPFDGPVPEVPLAVNQGRQKFLLDKARDEELTLGELARTFTGAGQFPATPIEVADQFEEWLETDAADGFMLSPPYLPEGLEEFTTMVVPELQRRGIYRTAYDGKTLRENLGLKRPENRFANATSAV